MSQALSVQQQLERGNEGLSVEVADISPELASQWLKVNAMNRRPREDRIIQYAEMMAAGQWKLTGDPIRFGAAGRLLDGQHRLMAVIRSGVTIRTLIIRGIEEDTFDCIDTNITRGGTDVLVIQGYAPGIARIASIAAKLSMAYDSGLIPGKRTYPNQYVRQYVTDNPALIKSATFLAEQPHTAPMSHSAGAFFHFQASKSDQSLADRFIAKLYTGADMPHGDIILDLRNRMISARLKGDPLSLMDSLWMSVKIWNSLRRGKPIRYVNNAAHRSDEQAFPVFL